MLNKWRTFRVFVSSTFSDFIEERNALKERVYPRLSNLCESHGARFQAVDLRWGVSEDDARNQETMRICLAEIKRSQEVSPRPNFAILIGDRYGWQPIPEEISAEDMEILLEHLNSNQGDLNWQKNLLEQWYRCDENCVPAIYVLKPRIGALGEEESWAQTERQILEILRGAAQHLGWNDLPLQDPRHWRYFVSATGQEIIHGALSGPDASDHVLCFTRSITDVPINASQLFLSNYFDVDPETGQYDKFAHQGLKAIQTKLQNLLPESNLFSYISRWNTYSSIRRITMDHIDQFCNDFYEGFKKIILEQLVTQGEVDPLIVEFEEHNNYAINQRKYFRGREDILYQILKHVAFPESEVFVIEGKSGSGKSALMAKAAEVIRIQHPEATVIHRFIGVTPSSRVPLSLIDSLEQEITYQLDFHVENEFGGDDLFEDRLRVLREMLSSVSKERPLVVLLDAIDQLENDNKAGRFLRIFTEYFKNVCFIMSTTPEETESTRHCLLSVCRSVLISDLDIADAKEILGLWLDSIEGSATVARTFRQLQPLQMEYILGCFKYDPTPLYLRLVFEQTRHWRSWNMPGVGNTVLANSTQEVIEQFFGLMEKEHGKLAVAQTLSYLVIARDGLAENELIDLLSSQQDIMEEYRSRSPKSPISDILPTIVFSRMYHMLEPYLTKCASGDIQVLKFFHSAFIKACSSRYLDEISLPRFHSHIAHYFATQPFCFSVGSENFASSQRDRVYNFRKLIELPYQQVHGQMVNDYLKLLTNLRFIEAKCGAGLIYDLMNDLNLSLQTEGFLPTDKALIIQEFDSWLKRQAHILNYWPDSTFQQAANEPDGTVVQLKADEWLKEGYFGPWLKWVNRAQTLEGCLMILSEHTMSVKCCAFSPNGCLLLSGSEDTTLRLWDVETGRVNKILTGHSGTINACAFSCDGRFIVSASDDATLKIWNTESGMVIATLAGHTKPVRSCVFSPDGKRIVSSSVDGTVKGWDLKSGTIVMDLIDEAGFGFGCCRFSPDGNQVVAASNRAFVVWDAESGLVVTKQGSPGLIYSCNYSKDGHHLLLTSKHIPIMVCDTKTWDCQLLVTSIDEKVTYGEFSPDGRYIVSNSNNREGILTIRDASTGVELVTLPGHSQTVTHCTYSADGHRIASSSKDGTLRIWGVSIMNKDQLSVKRKPDSTLDIQTISTWNPHTGFKDAYQVLKSSLIRACAYSPDGDRIITGAIDGDLTIWDGKTGMAIKNLGFKSREISGCAYSPNALQIAVSSIDGEFYLLESDSGKVLFRWRGPSRSSSRCDYSSTGSHVAWTLEDKIYILDLLTGDSPMTLSGHTGSVLHCILSPDGRLLSSSSADGTVIIWDVNNAKEKMKLSGHFSVVRRSAFSPDGQRIVSVSDDQTVRIWNVMTGYEIRCLPVEIGLCKFCSVAANGNDVYLVGSTGLWGYFSDKWLHLAIPEDRTLNACAMSPDCHYLVVDTQEGRIRLSELMNFATLGD